MVGVNKEALEIKRTESPILKFIDEIRSLATVTQVFQSRWEELQSDLDFIASSIEGREKQLAGLLQNLQQQQLTAANSSEAEPSNAMAKKVADPSPTSLECQKSVGTELETLCRKMLGKHLRKYMISYINDYNKLRQEIPSALKNAPDPAKLVLDCVGKFYLQGRKAYEKQSQQVSVRKAALLVLEFFLLSGVCDEIPPSLKEEAKSAALAWRKRISAESGLGNASKEDARGLLLLVTCFGISDSFIAEDLMRLLCLSNYRELGEALRKSSLFVGRLSDIIDAMKERGMCIEAVDVIYTFELEHKISPTTILLSFLSNQKEAFVAEIKKARDSVVLNNASKKYLATLKYVCKCLEDNNVDPVEVLPGWNLKDQIAELEKDIAQQQQDREKRKSDRVPSGNQDIKRSRFSGTASAYEPPSFGGLQQSVVADRSNIPLYPSDGSLQEIVVTNKSTIPLYPSDPGLAARINDYAGASAVPQYIPPYIPENAVGYGNRAGLPPVSMSGLVSASASSIHGELIADRYGQPYGESGFSRDRYGQSDRSLAGLSGSSVGHSFFDRPSGVDRFPGASGINRFPGGSVGFIEHGASSDLYQFADAVIEAGYGTSAFQNAGSLQQPRSSARYFG